MGRMRTTVAQWERVHCVDRPDPYPIRISDNLAEIVGSDAAGVPSFARQTVPSHAKGKSLTAISMNYRLPNRPV